MYKIVGLSCENRSKTYRRSRMLFRRLKPITYQRNSIALYLLSITMHDVVYGVTIII